MKAKPSLLKICFIGPKAYPLFCAEHAGAFGGAELDLYMLATELAKDEKFDVSFIVADYGQEPIEIIESVKVIKSVDFNKNRLGGIIKLYKAMRRAGADIYLIKTASAGAFAAALWCLLCRKIFIYRSAHTIDCDGTYIRGHLLTGTTFRAALRIAKIVIVQNNSDKQNMLRTMGLASVVIPNGHRLEAGQDKKRDIILWVGRNVSFKRPGLFIDLAKKFPDEKFLMICKGLKDDDSYKKLLLDAGEIENLEFLEQVSFDRIEDYFQRAKVFVCTSCAEGFANTYIQACKHSVGIVSLDVNPDGFLEKYNCGLCCNGQFETFANSLRFMLENNRYKGFGKNGRNYVEQNHDIKIVVDRYKKLFCDLTNKTQ